MFNIPDLVSQVRNAVQEETRVFEQHLLSIEEYLDAILQELRKLNVSKEQ